MNKDSLIVLNKEWQPYLSWFDAKIQPIMSELLSQLNLVLGPIKENAMLNNDWHSGLGEVKQRGRYENLLLSEWLLLDDEPDEFIRRVVSNEHLFLAPMPEEQKSNNTIIAFFDEGILQLGSLRLVHLVMMLLLDRRAKKQNSQFFWGVIQQPARLNVFEGLESLLSLLENRWLSALSNKNIVDWGAYLTDSNFDERWFIGAQITGQTLRPSNIITHCVYIRYQSDDNRKLNIRILEHNRTKSTVIVLPNEIICRKMLAGQLAPNSNYGSLELKTFVPVNISFPPCVSMTSNQIASLTDEANHIILCSFLDALSAKQKCKVNYQSISGSLLVLDFQNKKVIGLITKQSRVYIWQPSKELKEIELEYDHFSTYIEMKYTRFIWIYKNHGQSIYLIDNQNNMWSYDINKQPQDNVYKRLNIDINVLALFKLNDSKFLYIKFDDADKIWLKSPQLRHVNYCLKVSKKEITQILIADEMGWLNGFGVCALAIEQQWQVFKYDNGAQAQIELSVIIPNNWQVFGLYYQNDQLLFLIIHQDRKRIATFNISNSNIDELYYSTSNITQFSFSALAKSFALITENCNLIFYSMVTNSIRATIKTKEITC
ncbi:hypothetical protein RHO13_02055 [Orbus wheelerorum]|uniref:hypothetical protein n=1 Tax=Orbus wheelerorum TaxID=3074111 RepID=UPI00370D968B